MPGRDRWLFGKGKSKTTGLYKDVSASTKGKQIHSTTPDDWPWSKEFKRKYGKNLAFNKTEGVRSSEAMTFSDPQTPEERKELQANKRRVEAKKHKPLPPKGSWNWKPLRDSPVGPVLGYEATGKLKDRARIELRKQGRSKKWVLVFDGKDYPMPGKKASLDHAEGTLQKMTEAKRRTKFFQLGRDAFDQGIESPAPILNKKVFKQIQALKSDKERFKAMKDYSSGWQSANLDAPVPGIGSSKSVTAKRLGMKTPDDPEPAFRSKQKVVVTGKTKSNKEYHGDKKLYVIWQIGDYDQDLQARNYQFMDTKTRKKTWWHYPSESFDARPFMKNRDVKGKTYTESIPDVHLLIDSIVSGESPSDVLDDVFGELPSSKIEEKVSYAYDIRLDQNINTSPVRKGSTGHFYTVQGLNRRTQCESLQEKKKRLPKAAYDLLKDASGYHPPQVKYMQKQRVKYIDDFVKRGWLTRTDVGSYQEGVKITKAGQEALMKDEW